MVVRNFVMRQRQDIDQSQYLACNLISMEELQNGETREKERQGKENEEQGISDRRVCVREKKTSLCCKVARLRLLVLLVLLVCT
jgi:hypothetical protein